MRWTRSKLIRWGQRWPAARWVGDATWEWSSVSPGPVNFHKPFFLAQFPHKVRSLNEILAATHHQLEVKVCWQRPDILFGWITSQQHFGRIVFSSNPVKICDKNQRIPWNSYPNGCLNGTNPLRWNYFRSVTSYADCNGNYIHLLLQWDRWYFWWV